MRRYGGSKGSSPAWDTGSQGPAVAVDQHEPVRALGADEVPGLADLVALQRREPELLLGLLRACAGPPPRASRRLPRTRAPGRRPPGWPPRAAWPLRPCPTARRCGPGRRRHRGSARRPTRVPVGRVPSWSWVSERRQQARAVGGGLGERDADERRSGQQGVVEVVRPVLAPRVLRLGDARDEPHPLVGRALVQLVGRLVPVVGNGQRQAVDAAGPGRPGREDHCRPRPSRRSPAAARSVAPRAAMAGSARATSRAIPRTRTAPTLLVVRNAAAPGTFSKDQRSSSPNGVGWSGRVHPHHEHGSRDDQQQGQPARRPADQLGGGHQEDRQKRSWPTTTKGFVRYDAKPGCHGPSTSLPYNGHSPSPRTTSAYDEGAAMPSRDSLNCVTWLPAPRAATEGTNQ